jgi:hypothetical protein
MSLCWLRQSSRAVATVLLLVFMCQLPHLRQDDDLCAPAAPEAHDESKHVFTTAAGPDHPNHCAICHWTRSVRPTFSSGSEVIVGLDARGDLFAASSRILRDRSADRLPPRAPPAL